jgi:prepilin-type N-terminal cleavage/methylation domain-containing protein
MTENSPKRGYTLIEILVVLTIIGILAAIAIPLYLGQTTRAKLAEVTNAVGYIASAVAIYHHEAIQNGAVNGWPNCGSMIEIQTSLGVAIPTGRINAASVDQGTGVISVTVTNIDSAVEGSTLTLTPLVDASGSAISWKWGGTIPPRYLPMQ